MYVVFEVFALQMMVGCGRTTFLLDHTFCCSHLLDFAFVLSK
jgi:hypothetical protein